MALWQAKTSAPERGGGGRAARGSGQNDSRDDVTAETEGLAARPGGALPARQSPAPEERPPSPLTPPVAWLVTLARSVLFVMMLGAARVFFRRVTIRHRDRCPRHAAVLVIANHPATWTDVVLLHLALARGLHFMAHASLYRPRIRKWFLRLYETVPIYYREDTSQPEVRNDDAFEACHRMFDRGEAVAAFPEGVSQTDWRIQPLRSGAARLALGYDALPGRRGRLAVVPVGLYYEDRTALRGTVEIVIGEPVDLSGFRHQANGDLHAAARSLTHRLFEALAGLVVHFPDAELEALGRELAPIVLPSWRAARPGADALTLAREMAAAIERLAGEAPLRLAELWRRVKVYRRMRVALGLSDRVLRETVPAERQWPVALRLLVVGLVGAPPALAGLAINILPHQLTEWIVRRLAPESSRIAFARITAGVVLFPATYLVWGWALRRATGLPHPAVAGLLGLGLLLGFVAIAWWQRLKSDVLRFRLIRLERRAPRQIARARAARAALLELVESAREGLPA